LLDAETTLVYGGGRVGLMGILADTVLDPAVRRSGLSLKSWYGAR
jgi:predicted Rossmann-fold nucleotide-binding protein